MAKRLFRKALSAPGLLRNAAKRLLGDVRREHPHLKLIVVEDADSRAK